MGWGNKFPILTQLNLITRTPQRRDAVWEFFVDKYGQEGGDYRVGYLCRDWVPGPDIDPRPPWDTDKQNPWKQDQADEWKSHCQNDLDAKNTGHDLTLKSTGNTVEEDLTQWIKDAILAKQQIIYKFVRDDDQIPWKADLGITGPIWHITVTGPGW
jgi:hypothetical protein